MPVNSVVNGLSLRYGQFFSASPGLRRCWAIGALAVDARGTGDGRREEEQLEFVRLRSFCSSLTDTSFRKLGPHWSNIGHFLSHQMLERKKKRGNRENVVRARLPISRRVFGGRLAVPERGLVRGPLTPKVTSESALGMGNSFTVSLINLHSPRAEKHLVACVLCILPLIGALLRFVVVLMIWVGVPRATFFSETTSMPTASVHYIHRLIDLFVRRASPFLRRGLNFRFLDGNSLECLPGTNAT